MFVITQKIMVVCLYVCVCTYGWMCVLCVYVCMYVLTFLCVYVCTYVFIYVLCLHMCVYAYVYIRTFVCICGCVFIYWFCVHMYVFMYDVTETVRSPTFYIPFRPSAADKPSIPLVCPSYCLAGGAHFSTCVDHMLSAVRERPYLSTLLIFISCRAVFVTPFSLIVR
jgi:hypothetical protein